MKSLWASDVEIGGKNPLNDDLKVEVAIIGAGMSGVLCAYKLKEKGFDVALFEAGKTGCGQTKNTTAKITSSHNIIYDYLIKHFGQDLARQYAMANEKAITDYENIIKKHNISCEFEKADSYLYTNCEDNNFTKEFEAAKSLGLPVELVYEIELPIKIKTAIRYKNQAMFHPLKFINHISRDLTVYENTKVTAVTEISDERYNFVIDANNHKVLAKYVVVASHYPFINVPGYYFLRMHRERSYVIGLKNAPLPEGMYLGVDSDGLSFRKSKNILLLGGAGHRCGDEGKIDCYNYLKLKAKEIYPGSCVEYMWSAQDCVTVDKVPYIGYFSADNKNMFVATGFGKWGMTNSMVAANIISDLISGIDNPCKEVYSPQRFKITASIKSLFEDALESAKGYGKNITLPKNEDLGIVPKGRGMVLTYEGKKVGAYRDEDGKIYLVDTTCPHLGCQLSWNQDELSWDCPCHGSRFDYKGNLIDNPAINNLEVLSD